MMWKKAPQELVDFLAEKMESVNCEYCKVFGYPAYFINGNMFAGIHQDKLFLRLSQSDIQKIRKEHSDVLPFEPMLGKIMIEYVVLPKLVYSNSEEFIEWLNRSIKHASSLPPKQKKK